MQTDFLKNKQKWLEEVSNDCHSFATQTDLDFYVFQTPCEKPNPDLLIIGINPGGLKPYSQTLREKGYGQRPPHDLGYNENTLIEKPAWENGKGSDVLRERLGRLFNDKNELNILADSVMMNMFYFNTNQAKDINGYSQNILEYCSKKTIEFIDLLNPKNILFLTTNQYLLKQCQVKLTGEVLEGHIKKGQLNGRIVYAMPHYGWYRGYSYDNCAKMAGSLKSFLQL